MDFDEHNLFNRIYQFKSSDGDDEHLHTSFNINIKKGWDIRKAWKNLQNYSIEELRNKIYKIEYRPFEIKYIFYDDSVVWRTVKIIMENMIERDNIGLCFMRQFSGNMPYTHFFVTNLMVDNRTFFSSKGTIQFAPLYIYKDKESNDIFEQLDLDKRANIAEGVIKKLRELYGFIPEPEEILHYIYGVFYSNIYREKYREFLNIDFPRVPFTPEVEIFREMAVLGERLVGLHLLKSSELDSPLVRYEGEGNNEKIEKTQYLQKRVYINDSHYFEGIELEVWEYQIGGYQVLHKYLKDRKGKVMEDPRHYCRVATALSKTIEIQREIDKVYERLEESVLDEN